MSDEIKAIYENGVFRPLEPVQWSEQQQVTVRLVNATDVPKNGERAAENETSTEDDIWTEEKNQRRCDLIDKEIDGTLSTEEEKELAQLQDAMLAYRRQVAPLPLDDLRILHQELLEEASNHRKDN